MDLSPTFYLTLSGISASRLLSNPKTLYLPGFLVIASEPAEDMERQAGKEYTQKPEHTHVLYLKFGKFFLCTLKIWQSHKPQKTEVKFSPALKSVSCLRFVPLTFYENQSANLVSRSKRAEEKIFWR